MREIQLEIFGTTVIYNEHLVAESPKQAFYDLFLEYKDGRYLVRKESGASNKILDRRYWHADSHEKAVKMYKQKLRAKLNPNRNSPRIYRRSAA